LNQVVLCPVLVDGLVVAVASFGMCNERPTWNSADLEIIQAMTGYAAVALEHGLTHQRTREVALVLQRALLSPPPQVPGLEVCVRYRPAGNDEVGGDWYDVLELGPGALAVTVGDVVGHDITAAAAMGQLRAMLRALAIEGDAEPGAVLTRLAAANQRLAITSYATVLFARLTRAATGWDLTWANAGHPPPLLIDPDGRAAPLELLGGPGLFGGFTGAYRSGRLRMERPGTTLLLYTDGLIERRGTNLAESIAAMCRRVARPPAEQTIEDCCDLLLDEAPTDDDIAMVAVRTT
jgi:serine phosphatase RsbU (regulator of sigma subunit)